jgi:5-oxoprolinase (ATP-hydrolysing)
MGSDTRQTAEWEFWIDRGGTFTDIIAKKPDGSLITYKLLSDNPNYYQDAILYGIRSILNVPAPGEIPSHLIRSIKIGTTLGTNALLEKKGQPTALLITKGFADILKIGYQNRPDLFALNIKLPQQLYSSVYEIEERVSANGELIRPINLKDAELILKKIYRKGIRAIAIVFIHSYKFPQHEIAIAKIANELGFHQISVSHEVSPRIKLVTRGNITVVDAYLTPIFKDYISNLESEVKHSRLFFMQSYGGLIEAKLFRGKNGILSGPTAGLVAAITMSLKSGINKIISFDMGGTSTDVAHFNGQYERVFETNIAGYQIQTPMLDIHTIASGGGSILSFQQNRFQVGPKSAGANPGPASYGKGGPLTITDCHVLLGRIQSEFFPKVFGRNGQQPLNKRIVKSKFARLLKSINKEYYPHLTEEKAAEGFLKIAILLMANAIKKISTERGYDLRQYTLCCFGSAGGQHACQIADLLNIPKIVIHKYSGLLSAYGLGLAKIKIIREKSLQKNLISTEQNELVAIFNRLIDKSKKEIFKQKLYPIEISWQLFLRLKYQGSDYPLVIEFKNYKHIKNEFEKLHLQRYGFTLSDKEIIIDSLFIEMSASETELSSEPMSFSKRRSKPKVHQYIDMYQNNTWQKTSLYLRDELKPGNSVVGPGIIIEKYNTIIVEDGWQARISLQQDILLQKSKNIKKSTETYRKLKSNPVTLEIFNNLFSFIAEEMGTVLSVTAYSINIKERLDYSCAIFDRQGNLIANAQHIPVHLGSMSESVKYLISNADNISNGDAYINNNPYKGGTHLPDITVISPVFFQGHPKPLFYVASRGHHADVGGITPGSIPPFSKNIHEEGILIDCFTLVKQGKFQEQALLKLLKHSPWPARNPKQNLADLKAQVAANQKGIIELQKIVSQYSLKIVLAYVKYMRKNATSVIENLIPKIKNGKFCYLLDNHSKICTKITTDIIHKNITIDFTGTSNQQNNNFNAPLAVCYAAVLYVFRTLVAANIPLNEGVLKPIKLIIPANSMLNPKYPAAIVAGNVETSQCLVDTLYGALKTMAASQGTMNNFTFGNDKYQYYETLCGGSGAGPGFNGTSAVHTHMTNSRLTDPEILEATFPIVIESFAIRKKSGGNGRWQGGDGIVRKIRFLEPMTATILSNRRIIPPYGMAGGEPGKKGRNSVIRTNGKTEIVKSNQIVHMEYNDMFIIATPGGGGYGAKPKNPFKAF